MSKITRAFYLPAKKPDTVSQAVAIMLAPEIDRHVAGQNSSSRWDSPMHADAEPVRRMCAAHLIDAIPNRLGVDSIGSA